MITHFHSDHIGASAALVALTGAEEIVQGREDRASTERSFGRARRRARSRPSTCAAAGMPEELDRRPGSARRSSRARELAEPTRLVEEGDQVEIAGVPFRVLVLRGHADGHIVLHDERDGRLLGGDVLLQRITPNVGVVGGLAPRSARRLPRDARPPRGARAADHLPGPPRSDRERRRARGRDASAPRAAARQHRGRAADRRRDARTRSASGSGRSRSACTSGASPSPRRSRT